MNKPSQVTPGSVWDNVGPASGKAGVATVVSSRDHRVRYATSNGPNEQYVPLGRFLRNWKLRG